MGRHSLRFRLLLPTFVIMVTVVVVATWLTASKSADRVHANADETIERQANAIQSMMLVTRAIMLERVKDTMNLLKYEGNQIGAAAVGSETEVADRPVNDLTLGDQTLANNFELVDHVTSLMGGTATIFSRYNEEFVRITTNVQKDDGTRAIGTILDPEGPVIKKLENSSSFYGVVDILGNPYVTGYEPITTSANITIGAWYVGYKTDLKPLEDVIGTSTVMTNGFLALYDDTNNKLRFHSEQENLTAADIEKIVEDNPADWKIIRKEIPNWGFTLVSAYPLEDVDSVIREQSLWIIVIGVIVSIALIGSQSFLIWSRVLKPIQSLTKIAEEQSVGRWEQQITEVELKDEIGALARAVNRLSNSVRLAMERLKR